MGTQTERAGLSGALATTVAVVIGLVLASFPVLQYRGHGGHHARPHSNHASAYGGQLSMVGDHHIELLIDGQRVDVHVSDGLRRPVRARRGSLRLPDGTVLLLAWQSHRLTAAVGAASFLDATEVTLEVELTDGASLQSEFQIQATPANS